MFTNNTVTDVKMSNRHYVRQMKEEVLQTGRSTLSTEPIPEYQIVDTRSLYTDWFSTLTRGLLNPISMISQRCLCDCV